MIKNLIWVKEQVGRERIGLYFTINKQRYNTYLCLCGCGALFTVNLKSTLKKAMSLGNEEKCEKPEPKIADKFIKEAERVADFLLKNKK